MLEVEIPPEKMTSYPSVASWKERDYAQTEHSQEMAATIASQSQCVRLKIINNKSHGGKKH